MQVAEVSCTSTRAVLDIGGGAKKRTALSARHPSVVGMRADAGVQDGVSRIGLYRRSISLALSSSVLTLPVDVYGAGQAPVALVGGKSSSVNAPVFLRPGSGAGGPAEPATDVAPSWWTVLRTDH
jgi:hypothetical protein